MVRLIDGDREGGWMKGGGSRGPKDQRRDGGSDIAILNCHYLQTY